MANEAEDVVMGDLGKLLSEIVGQMDLTQKKVILYYSL